MDGSTLTTDVLDVTVSDDEVVLRATIDRPSHRNAINAAVISSLTTVFEAADDGPVRVVVVRGADGTFSSGGDMSEMPIGGNVEAFREGFSGLAELIAVMHATSALTVAGVEGYCLAGGLGLAAACEFIVAADDATFGTPEVNVGLFPVQAMAPIMRTVPEKRGLKLLFTGNHIDAAEAADMGLVTDLVPSDTFDDHLDDFVETLAGNSPVMIEMGKEAYYQHREMPFREALSYLKEMIALLAMSDDTAEGIDAFLSDRDPEWRAR